MCYKLRNKQQDLQEMNTSIQQGIIKLIENDSLKLACHVSLEMSVISSTVVWSTLIKKSNKVLLTHSKRSNARHCWPFSYMSYFEECPSQQTLNNQYFHQIFAYENIEKSA